jgi:hydroxypyruvate isomerase
MNFALSMWSVHRTVKEEGWSVIDFLRFCKKEGIKEVELLDIFWQDLETQVDQVNTFCREHDLKVASYAVTNNFVEENSNLRLNAVHQITDAIPVAKRLRTSVIRVFAGNIREGIAFETGLQWIIEGLSAAADVAEQANVILCLENHGQLAGSGAQVKQIIEKVNSVALRSTLDVGNFLLVDENPTEAARTLLPYVSHVHVKDFKERQGGIYHSLNKKEFEGTVAGDGDVDLPVILGLLQESGYKGAYVLEYEGAGNETEGIRSSYQYFDKLVNGI